MLYKLCILFQIMNELFADKPWVKPIAVAGSHLDEEDEKENTPQEKCKIKHALCVLYKLCKYIANIYLTFGFRY